MKARLLSWDEVAASEILARHAGRDGALLPLLHELQEAFGHVPDIAIGMVAGALNLSRAEVYGVVSFYHDFRAAPSALPVVKLCRAEACQARGAEAIAAHVRYRADVAVEPIYCLGLCASGPAAMVGDQVHARLDAARFDRLLDGLVA